VAYHRQITFYLQAGGWSDIDDKDCNHQIIFTQYTCDK